MKVFLLNLVVAICIISVALQIDAADLLYQEGHPRRQTFAGATPLYKINLDEDPQARWTKVAQDYHKEANRAIQQFLGTAPKAVLFFARIVAANLDAALPGDYGSELVGIARAANVSLGDMVLLNIIYDVTAFCTGIVANDNYGAVWHGRNLDYGNNVGQTDALKRMTIRVDFYKAGKLQFSGVTFAGYVGLLTAWKPNGFSISSNERDRGSLVSNLLSAAVELLKGGRIYPVTMIARMSMERDGDFATAVRRLTTEQLIAPVYYIVAGRRTDEGIVIVRNQMATVGVNRLNSQAGKWFLVQTNYDPWVPPPAGDDRRDPAIKSMIALGQSNVSMGNVLKILSMPPVLNSHTAYSSVFSAAYGNQSVTVIR